jgi:hypothetical protein
MFKRGGDGNFRRGNDGFRHRGQDNIWVGGGSTAAVDRYLSGPRFDVRHTADE